MFDHMTRINKFSCQTRITSAYGCLLAAFHAAAASLSYQSLSKPERGKGFGRKKLSKAGGSLHTVYNLGQTGQALS